MKIINRVVARMGVFSLAVIWGVSPLVAPAQLAPRENVTAGYTNGRLWLDMPNNNTKTIYLLGCSDAFLSASRITALDKPKFADDLKLPNLTFPEIIKELDLFYSEGANGPIPIISGLDYVRHKAAGDSPEDLQFMLLSLRKVAAIRF
jgi:hypothetical protein